MTRLVRYSSVLLFVLCVSSPLLLSQTNTTALSGIVTDATGASLPNANVTIANGATGATQTTQSKSKGEFSFEQIQPGSYLVKVSAPGFSEQDEKVELLVSTPMKLEFKLTAGSTEVVNVETNLAAVNTSDGTLGKAFNSEQVQNLPYLANNITYLLSLQPGVLALDSGGATGGLNTDERTGIVNGARQDQTNITLDGVDNNDQIFGYAFNGALRSTRDSVEEFRVTTTNANADAGRSSGAQVSLVTKSGTNAIHGSAYEYYRDPATASNNWFIKQSQLSSGEPNIAAKVLQHTYGASLGAPIKKDKLFFFGAYEGFKQASDIPVGRTVPSAFGSKAGSVTGLASGNVTYLAADGSVKTLTPTDIAQLDKRGADKSCTPATCVAPATDTSAIAYFNTFPLANAPGAADSYNTGNYNFVSPAPIHQITNIARLDYVMNSKQTVFVRGNLQSDNQASALQFPDLPAASTIYGNSKGIAAGHIWSLNDHTTNNFRYGFTRIGSASRGTGSQPYTSFGAFDTITATTTSSTYLVSTNNFTDDFTLVKGRHTIQAGADFYVISNAQYFDSPLLSYSSITPNLLATAAIAGLGGSLDPGTGQCGADCVPVAGGYSNFYNNAIIANVGAIEAAQSGTEFKIAGNSLVPAVGVPTHTFKNLEQEYYVQDQWKATSHLTLTAGLRYVYLGVPYEKNGQQIAPTIAADTFLADRASAAAAGTAYDTDISFRPSGSANGQPNFWTPQKLNFAPRFAFAYATADNKTSIRGGFALAYDHFGSALIDTYQSDPQSLFSLSQINLATYTDINSNPRFQGYHDTSAIPVEAAATQVFPITPPENSFTFDYSINDKQKTPYAETFNLTIQHELPHNFAVTASYVGRLGRHLVQNLDIAMPTNLADPTSGQTYFQAAQAFDKMADAGIDPSTVPDSGYFHNIFPNLSYTFTPAATGANPNPAPVTYYGAQGYYAVFASNRGNETNALYAADCAPQAICNSLAGLSNTGPSFRFFFPQTSSVAVQSSTGTSNYNALQLSIRQELRSGLEYDVNYTMSKSLDEGSDPERNGTTGSLIINSFSPHQWYGDSDFDVRHNLTANYTAPFPFGRGQMFLNHGGLTDRLFGGFQFNGVVHYSTGFPFSAVAAGNWGTNFAFNSYMVQTGKITTGGHQYDKANQEETALKGMTSAQATANLRFAYVGEAGQRNNFRSDGYLSLDDGLSKSFRVWGEHQLRLSAEVFNVLNTNRFATPQTDGTSSTSFGVYQNSAAQTNSILQTSTSSLLLQPRQMQFSGKFIF